MFTGSTSIRSRKKKEYERPNFKDAYGELLHLASEWTAIGALLGVPPEVVTKISVEHTDVHTCLSEVVSRWHDRYPRPYWVDIFNAIEKITASKARMNSSI